MKKWFKPWKGKSFQSIVEEKTGVSTTRLTPKKDPALWEDKPIAPSNANYNGSKKKKRTYFDTYKDTKWDDEDYYNESAFPTHGQVASRQSSGGTLMWKNGKRVRDHKAIENKSTYTPVVAKKEYEWVPTRWATYSFDGWSGYAGVKSADDNSRLFIKEPESYITPSAAEIKAKLLVYDTIHTDAVKNLCRLFYIRMTDEKDYIKTEMLDELGYDEYKKQLNFYTSAYDGFVPGFTPLEQAINYYQAVLDKQRQKGSGTGSGVDNISFEREDFNNPHLNEQMRWNTISEKNQINVLNKISLIGQLGHEFHVEKESGEKEVANSPMYKTKTMSSYEQINKIALYQRVLPTYRHKFLTKALQVNVPVQTSEKKQKIIILVDYSGSMDSDKKQLWVNAILADRFRYVMKGEAEVFFSFFVDNPNYMKFTHVKNAKDVEEFWKTFSNNPSGGNTDIGRIVQYVADEVNRGQTLGNLSINLSHERPEILIINDGQDSVNCNKFPYKVNAISLMQFSDQLKKLCVDTGGKQVQVEENQNITTYSTNGSAVLQEK